MDKFCNTLGTKTSRVFHLQTRKNIPGYPSFFRFRRVESIDKDICVNQNFGHSVSCVLHTDLHASNHVFDGEQEGVCPILP